MTLQVLEASCCTPRVYQDVLVVHSLCRKCRDIHALGASVGVMCFTEVSVVRIWKRSKARWGRQGGAGSQRAVTSCLPSVPGWASGNVHFSGWVGGWAGGAEGVHVQWSKHVVVGKAAQAHIHTGIAGLQQMEW